MKNLLSLSILTSLLLLSCSNNKNVLGPNGDGEWLISSNLVMDGGPGKDGIPSIDNPKFTTASEIDFLIDNDLVIGVIYNGEARAYPHAILDWHEIVNDAIGDKQFALTYCPLTGTAISWNRVLDGVSTSFGVSGKLYNSNLMPYDRSTDSYWSQMELNCVNGEKIGTAAEIFPIIETTWKTWKLMYPDSDVLNTDTGVNRNYNNYPYGDYITNQDRIIFPLTKVDNRLPLKERVLGILHNETNKAYSLNLFETPRIIYDNVGGTDLMIVGSKTDNFVLAFNNPNLTDFTLDLSNLPIIGKDADGNELDITGKFVAGPMIGTQLEQPLAFMGYWFSFGTFYDDLELYTE